MKPKLDIPAFATESAEAAWWPTQEETIGAMMQQAVKDGALQKRTPARKPAMPTITIRLDPSDVDLVKKQAESRGIPYQTYLTKLIHEALHSR